MTMPMRSLLLMSVALLAACGSTPPPPDWQMNAKGSAERAAEAWLSGNTKIEEVEFLRARSEIVRTGRPELVARLELTRCATRVAALVFEPCAGFEAVAGDAAPAEQAYARYLAGRAGADDAKLLPAPHQGLVGAQGADLKGIDDPLSRLIGGRRADAAQRRHTGRGRGGGRDRVATRLAPAVAGLARRAAQAGAGRGQDRRRRAHPAPHRPRRAALSAPAKKSHRGLRSGGLGMLVETRRIELPTFALRTRRSPS